MTDTKTFDVSSDRFNFGVSAIGPWESVAANNDSTYVVLGVSRGGTSAVAGLLSEFGVHMGRTGKAPLYEDLGINRALAKGMDEFKQRALANNEAHSNWGFKGNAITHPFEDIAQVLRNPIFVVVFRDLAAIAVRAKLSADRDVLSILQRQTLEYSRIIEFLAAGRYRSVVISYEKLLAYPENVIDLLADSIGLKPTDEVRQAAITSIRPAPEDYLRVSTATNTNE